MARSGINKVILVGNLGQDPEVRFTAGGAAVTTLSLATSESWKDKESGQDQEKTNLIINETLSWIKENIQNLNNQIETMISMADFLKKQDNFSISKREYFLMDIRNIARSDGLAD